MNLFIFGDSYFQYNKHPWIFLNLIKEKINCNLLPYALIGSDLSYTYNRFDVISKSITSNDILIIGLTSFNRKWFFPDLPGTTLPTMIVGNIKEKISKEMIKAVEDYFLYLQNPTMDKVHLKNWLNYLNYFVYDKKIRCLIIPCFDEINEFLKLYKSQWSNLSFAIGDLFSISRNEYCANLTEPYYDLKRNHLCRDNHIILADKILDWINFDSDVVLNGFYENIITDEVLRIPNWHDLELL
jgi:hypothetical protein